MSCSEDFELQYQEILYHLDQILSLGHEIADDCEDEKPSLDFLLCRVFFEESAILELEQKRVFLRNLAWPIAIYRVLHDVDSQKSQLGKGAIDVVAKGFQKLSSSSFGCFGGLLFIEKVSHFIYF